MKLSDITTLPRASVDEADEITAVLPRTPISNTYALPRYTTSVSRHHGCGGYLARSGDLIGTGATYDEALGQLVATISGAELGSPFILHIP
jgi:hypothetical protein